MSAPLLESAPYVCKWGTLDRLTNLGHSYLARARARILLADKCLQHRTIIKFLRVPFQKYLRSELPDFCQMIALHDSDHLCQICNFNHVRVDRIS